ncbi:MAG: tetratricopeptide repeat protein [Bradymonadia bacterium]
MKPALLACVVALSMLGGCGEKVISPEESVGFRQLVAARSAMDAHNYALAYSHYVQARRMGAGVRECRLGMIRALVAMGDLAEAERQSQSLVKAYNDEAEAMALAIQVELLVNDLDTAHQLLLKLEKLRPKGQMTILLKAETYLTAGFLSRAEQAIVEGENLHGELADWAFLRARLDLLRQYIDAGEAGYVQATETFRSPKSLVKLAYYQHLMERTHNAEETLLKAQEIAGTDPTAYAVLADFYTAQGRYDESMAELGALRQTLGMPTPDLARRAASVLLRKGQQAEAQSILRPVLNAQPNDGLVARELAMSYLLDGRAKEAGKVLLDVVVEKLDGANAQFLLGLVELQSENPLAAKKSFSALLVSQPGSLVARYGLGLVGLHSRRWYDASFEARKVLDISPNDYIAGLILGAARRGENKMEAVWVIKRWLLKRHPDRKAEIEHLFQLPPELKADPENPPRLPKHILNDGL